MNFTPIRVSTRLCTLASTRIYAARAHTFCNDVYTGNILHIMDIYLRERSLKRMDSKQIISISLVASSQMALARLSGFSSSTITRKADPQCRCTASVRRICVASSASGSCSKAECKHRDIEPAVRLIACPSKLSYAFATICVLVVYLSMLICY